MKLFSRLLGRTETRATVVTPEKDYLPLAVGGFGAIGYNDHGVTVTETTAVTCSAVWACVQIISQAVAALPVNVHRRDDATNLTNHPVVLLLDRNPNPYMTPAVFRETMLANALLWGAGYAFIEKDEMGVPVALYPLQASRTRPYRTPQGDLVYQTMVGTGQHFLTPDAVFYLPGLSLDGITALNVVMSARQTIGVSLAMERYAAKFFGSGGNVGGILKLPKMNDEAMKAFVASWRENYQGIENALRVAVLPDGYDFKPTSLEPEKSQMNESRQSQVLDVARFYRVPPFMLGLLDKGSSYSSVEQATTFFYENTIRPYCVKFEQEADRKLLLTREQPLLEIKLTMDAVLRASTTERYTAYQTGRQGGWLSINDIRRKENLPPVPGGDALMTPLNMAPVNGPNPTTPPAPTPDKAAARMLVEDAARRLLTKESKALLRAAKKFTGRSAEMNDWAKQWYASHQPLVAQTIAASLKAAGVTVPADQVAADHCAASVRAIAVAVESGADAQDLADEMTDIRPVALAEALLQGVQ